MVRKVLAIALALMLIPFAFAEEEYETRSFVILEYCDQYFKDMLGYVPVAVENGYYLEFPMINGEFIRAPFIEENGGVFVLDPRSIHSECLEEWSLIGKVENPLWDGQNRWVPTTWIAGYLGENGLGLDPHYLGDAIDLIATQGNDDPIWVVSQIPFISTKVNGFETYFIEEKEAAQFIYDAVVGIKYYYSSF